ncbi:hypothetical protein Pan44_30850 [Caulifigura coniformis]|uniref:DUF1844 domain-containing protein n=1 Tax=Caulifigura coniformis TaxID=2527983 RepID=A0A517SFZ5_9PLAN|nr:DUF1844 domain-containing protein [Caulifigura coniformis]QDT55044.1 hypothetical protein Pan44_30850 [Caulifigura coniformis]
MSTSDQDDTPTPQDSDVRRTAPLNIPPPSFTTLLQMLATQAMAAMGLIPGPDGKSHKEPAVAKHFVDLLGVLEVKCKGNLDSAEAKMLDTLLHDLRMAFVQASK